MEFFSTVSFLLFLHAYVLQLVVRTARLGFKLRTKPTFSNARALSDHFSVRNVDLSKANNFKEDIWQVLEINIKNAIFPVFLQNFNCQNEEDRLLLVIPKPAKTFALGGTS